eukprot:2896292-Pyramimonas_sp.AAC.1
MQGYATQCKAMQSLAKRCQAMQSSSEQCNARHSTAKQRNQCRAVQYNAIAQQCDCNAMAQHKAKQRQATPSN